MPSPTLYFSVPFRWRRRVQIKIDWCRDEQCAYTLLYGRHCHQFNSLQEALDFALKHNLRPKVCFAR